MDSAPDSRNMHSGKVYIVDDSADHSFLLFQVIKKFLPPYSVRFFEDGQSLHRHLLNKSIKGQNNDLPALIILDLNMPVISGYQMLKMLKSPDPKTNPAWKGIPVVMMTSDTGKDKMKACYEAGANAFIVKPDNVENLTNLMTCVCKFWLEMNQTAYSAYRDN